jgi:hypothetical protein
MAIIARYSSVFEMNEFQFKRETEVPKEKVQLKFEGVDFSWGFKIKQSSAAEKDGPSEKKSDVAQKQSILDKFKQKIERVN